jgi:hypothetical protein
MDANTNDDSRKKRDSTDVVEADSAKSEEKTKKLRAGKQRPFVPCKDFKFVDQPAPARSALALEDALQLLVRMGNDNNLKEYLSETKWVNFRLGSVADASQIASCYRKRKRKQCDTDSLTENKTDSANIPLAEDPALEMTLVDGLGGGDSPPSVFAFLADIVSDIVDCRRVLGAAALLSSGWEDSLKALRVEFFYVIEDDNFSDVAGVLERRMWLRLSVLATMTSHQLILAEALAKAPSEAD